MCLVACFHRAIRYGLVYIFCLFQLDRHIQPTCTSSFLGPLQLLVHKTMVRLVWSYWHHTTQSINWGTEKKVCFSVRTSYTSAMTNVAHKALHGMTVVCFWKYHLFCLEGRGIFHIYQQVALCKTYIYIYIPSSKIITVCNIHFYLNVLWMNCVIGVGQSQSAQGKSPSQGG